MISGILRRSFPLQQWGTRGTLAISYSPHCHPPAHPLVAGHHMELLVAGWLLDFRVLWSKEITRSQTDREHVVFIQSSRKIIFGQGPAEAGRWSYCYSRLASLHGEDMFPFPRRTFNNFFLWLILCGPRDIVILKVSQERVSGRYLLTLFLQISDSFSLSSSY